MYFALVLLLLFACGGYGGGMDALGRTLLGPFWECVLLSPFCLWFLGFGGVFWVVSPVPNLSKIPGNIINSYEMYVQTY